MVLINGRKYSWLLNAYFYLTAIAPYNTPFSYRRFKNLLDY